MTDFVRGIHDLGRGAHALAARPRLWKWLLAPTAVALVLLAGAVALIWHLVGRVIDWLTAHLPHWLASITGPLLSAAVVVALVIAALLIFVAVAGAIAGPFLEMLSEHLEADLTGIEPPAFSLPRFLHELATSIGHGIRRIAIALLGIAVVFALGFVPVAGPVIALIASGWFAARAAAYDCYDAVLARKGLSYQAKLDYLAAHRARTLGLGAAVAALLLVPFANLIALGLGAAGSTIAAVERRPP
ncbi:MAG TPA: EI24 domain-containing protein [Kofleriaceae bacterium]|nr:EI24 domain-containing protein [Kofleriaceae bacterium]